MLITNHKIVNCDSRNLSFIKDSSISLVVTSPPYPMIKMWDSVFEEMNGEVGSALKDFDGRRAFSLMHTELDKVWRELFRVLADGGFVCINIGDATRKIGDKFMLYSNHYRIMQAFFEIGFDFLPIIHWRKQTNAPNKFMGSGMLPAGAYVTLEHEYILIFRKNGKREFNSEEEKKNRQSSAIFWEERNTWYSDVWDFKGIKQNMDNGELRNRSGAYPLELAYRLVNMYSVTGDNILDPFTGTGTTVYASMISARNSIGVEIDPLFSNYIKEEIPGKVCDLNRYVSDRYNSHIKFVDKHQLKNGVLKYKNKPHGFPVMTQQETELMLYYIDYYNEEPNNSYKTGYKKYNGTTIQGNLGF